MSPLFGDFGLAFLFRMPAPKQREGWSASSRLQKLAIMPHRTDWLSRSVRGIRKPTAQSCQAEIPWMHVTPLRSSESAFDGSERSSHVTCESKRIPEAPSSLGLRNLDGEGVAEPLRVVSGVPSQYDRKSPARNRMPSDYSVGFSPMPMSGFVLRRHQFPLDPPELPELSDYNTAPQPGEEKDSGQRNRIALCQNLAISKDEGIGAWPHRLPLHIVNSKRAPGRIGWPWPRLRRRLP